MSSRRLRIWACTDTSRADTGSSQMIRSGSVTTARAIEIRWHCPPENSWGLRSAAASTSIPTVSSTSLTLARRCSASPRFQIRSGSSTMSATARRGFNDEIGSWKIICIRGRVARRAEPFSAVSSVSPSFTIPRVGRGSCMIALPVVDLPQPDSPTSPRVSPLCRSKLTLDTADTLRPRPTGNSITRFSTRSSASSGLRMCADPLPAILCSIGRGARRRTADEQALGGQAVLDLDRFG